jgi:MFS family permease
MLRGMYYRRSLYCAPADILSLFGRTLPGWIGDQVGSYNTQIVMCFFPGIIVLALWLPATANITLIIFAALYGLGSGAFVSLIPAMIAQISDTREIGLRVGIEFAIISVAALVSNPIGGAFIDHDHGRFRALQIWCGVVLLAGSTSSFLPGVHWSVSRSMRRHRLNLDVEKHQMSQHLNLGSMGVESGVVALTRIVACTGGKGRFS